jgi:hypothetical protein
VDQTGRPIPVNQIQPESEEDQKYFDSALRRRELRLVLSGKLKPEEATHVRSIFLPE